MLQKLLWFVTALLALSNASSDTECPAVPATSSDRRPSNNSLRIVQYNVEWLFMDYYSQADCPGQHCPWSNTSEAEIHMNYVSNIVKTLNPDILNLCEVEGCDELNMLIDNLEYGETVKTYRPYLKKGTDSATGQNVGMITRIDPDIDLYRTDLRYDYPVPGSKCGYTGTPGTSGVSKHYITEFIVASTKIAMIGLHLLAYPTDSQRCAEREAQAQVLQNIIYGYTSQKYEVIVLGDFNDFDGRVVDANNNLPISQVLDIVKGNVGEYNGKYQLFSVAETMVKDTRFTDWYDQNNNCVSAPTEFSMIDHVLVTSYLLDRVNNSYIYHGYEEFCGKYNSDHYPIVVDFIL
jgi:exonuclease III